MISRRLLGALLLTGAMFLGSSRAEDAPPEGLDVRTVIAELRQAAIRMDASDMPMEHLDQLQRWDLLVSASRSIQTSVTAAVQQTDQAVKTLQTSADKYRSDPEKFRVLETRIESLKEKADRLILLDAELTKAITGTVARLEKVRADPEVQQALEVQATLDRTRSALDAAESAVPDLLKQ